MSSSPLQQRWATMRTLWFALSMSHVLLAVALWFVRFGPAARPLPPNESIDLLVMVLGGLGVVEGAVSLILPRWQLRQVAQKLGISPGARLSEEQTLRLIPAAQMGLILGMAISEAVTLLGFVLGFLGAKPLQFAPFFVAGFLLAVHRFPGEGWLRGQIGASDTL